MIVLCFFVNLNIKKKNQKKKPKELAFLIISLLTFTSILRRSLLQSKIGVVILRK